MEELKKDDLDIKKIKIDESIDLLEMKSIKGGVVSHSLPHCTNQCHSKHFACTSPSDVQCKLKKI